MAALGDAPEEVDYTFKILLVGDSGVGKSSLLLRFATGGFEDLSPTIGIDFKAKICQLGGKKVKLTIWDTAGQERFRTLTSSYYRGAQGVILVHDVTRAETFESLGDVWMRELDAYGTVPDNVLMVVANKLDLADQREVPKEDGLAFARAHGCLYVETSAKGNVAVDQAFTELVEKILESPALLESTVGGGFGLKAQQQRSGGGTGCCG